MDTMTSDTRDARCALASDIAAELGGSWHLDDRFPDNVWPWITDDDGRTLGFSTPWNAKEKVEVHGVYPRTDAGEAMWSHRDPHASIRVRRDRGAEVIAREITRRLMPGYADALGVVRERIAADNGHRDAVRANAAALATAAGVTMPGRDARDQRNAGRVPWPHWLAGYGTIEASSDTAEVHLRALPVADAVAVVEFLRRRATD